MKKFALLFSALLFSIYLSAQNNCPLNIRVSTEMGTCYNNCRINIALIDDNGLPLDSTITDLSDFKYFCINTENWDTTYSYLNNFTVSPGNYKVGVQAICYYSTSSDSMYIRMERDTLVTTVTSYVTPILSAINHNATSLTDIGTIHSLSCINTGRIQLKITGGSFPYHVKICDEFDTPIDTLVFYNRMYDGEDENQYNYKDYYSIDSLAPGKYLMYVWDGCFYYLPVIWQKIETCNLPYINDVCWFYTSDNTKDHNVIKFSVKIENTNSVYESKIPDLMEYRFIYPEVGGSQDTTAWKHLPNGNYTSNPITITLYDTAYSVHRYCDLFDQPIIFQSRNNLCEEHFLSKSYTYRRPPYFTQQSTFYQDSSYTTPPQYDNCGYYNRKYTTYGHHDYSISHYRERCNSYYCNTCEGHTDRVYHHYTYPLYWVHTDTATHNVIKIDTVYSIGSYSYVRGNDIVGIYGDFKDSSITIPVQSTLYDGLDCELYTTFRKMTFKKDSITTGGDYNVRTFSLSSTIRGNCPGYRDVDIEERNSIPMIYNGDAVIKLISSPLGNKYNFTATYSQSNREWTIVKDSLSNLADITLSANSLHTKIADYFLPSGRYTFQITTPCSTYTTTSEISFPDKIEYFVSESAMYELTPYCTEMLIKPTAGKYIKLRHNTALSNNVSFTPGQPYTLTDTTASEFQIISGPVGGYSNDIVTLGGILRITIPGTYVIKMEPYNKDRNACDFNTMYDTIYFSGGTVEFDYNFAYVCDSNSTTGHVRIKGKNGTPPYTYTLYSAPDITGTILGVNTSGVFDDIPLYSGQQISVKITDSCMASFHVNFYVFDLEKTNKSWFSNGLRVTEVCEGSYVTVYAIGNSDFFSYIWTGPNGFSANTQYANSFIPRGAEDGYYKVTILNTGCLSPMIDSVYLNVNRAAKVVIEDDANICPGEEVQLRFNASGTGDVHYTIGHEENSVVSYQHYTNSNSFTYYPTSSERYWVHEVHDDLCGYSIPEDTIHITLKDQIATPCDMLTIPDTICLDSNAIVYATSTLATPYVIHWYDNFEQTHLIQADTIHNPTDEASFSFTQLGHDTVLYVTAHNNTHCETHYGSISRWLNMRNGVSFIQCGESIKLYDSGGYSYDYSEYENIIHTFTSTDGSSLTLKFNAFNTEEEYDKLIVYTGSGTNPDSVIASISGDLNSNLPIDIVSDGASMTLQFLSNGNTEYSGWEAVISNNPYPASVTATVTDSVKVQILPSSTTPVHYNGDVTLMAIASGGKNQQYEYHWFSSTDGINWTDENLAMASDTTYYTFSNLNRSRYVKVTVRDVSVDACGDSDTAVYFIPIANIKLSLNLPIETENPCNSMYKALLTVMNDGEQSAEDIVCHLHVPNNFYVNSDDTIIRINTLAANEAKTDTIQLMLLHRPSIDTTFLVKAQICSCRQGDSVPEVIYGDWDWQGLPRQVDEDTAKVHILPVFSPADYHLITINDETCMGNDALLSAYSDISAPQYFNWFTDPSLIHLVQTDTIFNPGDYAHYSINNLQEQTTLYVTVQNAEKCPPMASGIMDFKFELPITDTVIMHNGITHIGMNDHVKFYDTGGPDNNHGENEDFIHTFCTDEGVLKVNFRNINIYNSNTLYIYDGANINTPLIATLKNITGSISFTSTSGCLTFRFCSYNGYLRSGWDAEIVNSQTFKSAEATATPKAPLSSVNINTTDAEICYGEDALLTASSSIAFPQYYTWFDQNQNIVKQDTIHSGHSSLHLPEQITNSDYFIAISNDTSCTYMPPEQSILLLTADQHLKTTIIHPAEQIKFYDNGGPESVFTYHDTIITHTFKAQAGQLVVFQFNNCYYSSSDYIRLYDGEFPDDTHFIGSPNYGLTQQKTYTSTSNSLTISIKLRGTQIGWDAIVYAVDTVLLNTSVPHNESYVLPGHTYRFLDDGGPKGNYSLTHVKTTHLHTFKALQGNIMLNMKPYSIGAYDTLYIYQGDSDIPSKLLTHITNSNSSNNITLYINEPNVTFKFVNGPQYNGNGWDIHLHTIPLTGMAQAKVRLKAPSTNTAINATNDTICYNEKAVLTASSPIAHPQYFTWYNSDNNIILRDTVNVGMSTLELPNQKVTENFIITINNNSTCPLIVATDTLIDKTIESSSMKQNQTVYVSPVDRIQFTDEGGVYGHYLETPSGTYITTFTAIEGNVKAFFDNSNYNNIYYYDTLYIYDGLDGENLIFKATRTNFKNKTFISRGNSLTFKFIKKYQHGNDYGWYGTITSVPNDSIAEAWVYIRPPGNNKGIISTHDTLCFDGTATLYASAPEIEYPQYYTWISQDLKNIIYQDTVDGNSKTTSTLIMEHQRKDTLYYVTIKTDTVCPMVFMDSLFAIEQKSDFLLTEDKHNKTTFIKCTENIGFFDDGGKDNDYFTHRANYIHTFTSQDNSPLQLTLTHFNSENNWDNLYIYDGENTSSTQLAKLSGNQVCPLTYISNTGSLTVRWTTDGSGVRSGWEGSIKHVEPCLMDNVSISSVSIRSPLTKTAIRTTNDTVCYDQDAFLTASTSSSNSISFLTISSNSATSSSSSAISSSSSSTFRSISETLSISGTACTGSLISLAMPSFASSFFSSAFAGTSGLTSGSACTDSLISLAMPSFASSCFSSAFAEAFFSSTSGSSSSSGLSRLILFCPDILLMTLLLSKM